MNNEITSDFFKHDYALPMLYIIVIQYFNSHLFLYPPNQLFYKICLDLSTYLPNSLFTTPSISDFPSEIMLLPFEVYLLYVLLIYFVACQFF